MKLKAALSLDRTVFDDAEKDTLQGDNGRDWFFADLEGSSGDDDIVKDKDKDNDGTEMIFEGL